VDSSESDFHPVKPLAQAAPRKERSIYRRKMARPEQSQSAGAFAGVMMIYLVLVVGRPEDIVPGLAALPVAKIAALLAIIVAVQSRNALAAASVWSMKPARLALLIMMLVTASILFSVLKSETLQIIMGTVLATGIGVVLMLKAARNWRATRQLLLGCAISAMILAVSVELTRLGGRAGDTRNMDPNDFAFVLVGLLPIVVAFAAVSRGMKRVGYVVVSLWVILAMLDTQSRGGLLGLLCVTLVLVMLLPSSRRGRFAAQPSLSAIATRIVILAIGAFLIWHAVPQSARDRLSTITSLSSDYNMNANDRTGRMEIWKLTLPLSLRRPWGWGAGAFGSVNGRFGNGAYDAAHNMYLQALIELGFPGLILFLATLVSSVRRLLTEAFAHFDPGDAEAVERCVFARALVASILGSCLSGFFLSELYRQSLWVLITLACAVGRDPHQRGALAEAPRLIPRRQGIGSGAKQAKPQ
jgi:O-antigen ligase